MDGLLTIAGCDKTLPGDDAGDDPARPAVGLRLRRLDPARLLPGASDVAIQDVYEGIGAHATGKMSLEDLTELECVALPGAGSCASMYTANTMASVSEALGLTVPGMASPPATDPAPRADRAPRRGDPRRRARERPAAVGDPDEGVVRERDRGRRGARRLDERLPAPAGARGRGRDRLRPRRHRPDLAPHAADRRDAAGRPVHDAGPPRRGRRARS